MEIFFQGHFFRPLPNPYHPCFLPIYLHLVNFFYGTCRYIYIYIIHAMGKGAIGKPWKLHMNISKIIPYFLEGMRKWWESELMQVDVYKSMGICLARDCTWAWSPPRKGGRFGRIQLGLAGMLAHHSSLPASHPRCVTVTGRGGQPQVSTPAKTKLAVGF